ncbi:NAD-dependent succinate-semialdehyde dehydrogenase [Acrocarpospora macrocephala]|uniref:NAD-dependent succinate-semialdehyde dehydrogenase n=1 Tax=Acrocarpospora macrocephala TaxID=150177 RepID=A0A5M3WK54_9ACTN|nr:NAD-dependent succinate-semialdehyde dehydrogenase [Acrocarpospora macrocephala]GES09595.1 NAD-dependent succinate-semialdehyde dehydrogenase [Acrocarpospora macrocephala]
MFKTLNLIGGSWRHATDGASTVVTDPATDAVLAEVPRCTAFDVQDAIGAAAGALPAWRALSALDRAKVLRRLAALVDDQRDRLAALITSENGKPLAEARAEVEYGHGFLAWAAEEGLRVYGESVPSWNTDKRISVLRQPVGVTAAITPWNFPLAMLTRKLGPALATGCTMIVKPATQTPLTALALGELAVEAGVPAGVLNVVTGSGPVVAGPIFADPRVRKVSFTGSTEVGQELIRLSAGNVTRLSLELGGHAPLLVLDDADLDVAVAGTLRAKFRNTGQSCIAANRIYVVASRYEEFCAAYVEAVRTQRVGRGDQDVEIGPLIDDEAVKKVQEHVDDAVAKGATLACGGGTVDLGPGHSGRFFAPTVLTGVRPDMLISSEETFGPVAGISPVDDVDAAVELANDSPYGLAAYVFGRDIGQVTRVVERLEYGVVGVNDGTPSTAQAPFGGMKTSGYGREGGRYVMGEYLEIKYVSVAL